MRDHHPSLFLLRNSLASRMRRGMRSFCHGVASTSTLHTAGADADAASFLTVPSSAVGSCAAESEAAVSGTTTGAGGAQVAVTLEQMILQLDLEEEEAARKARRAAAAGEEEEERRGYPRRRMSCVNSNDLVLRSARDALSQYPRFSLDGRDAMYRASFSSYYEGTGLGAAGRHGSNRRASVCCAAGARACGAEAGGYEVELERMPDTVAGESVVWCKPGVVAKLMGLEAVPVPIRCGRRGGISGGRRKASGPPPAAAAGGGGGGRKQQRLIRRMGKEEMEKERLFMALHGYDVVGAGACHAGAIRGTVGPSVSGLGRDGDGWQLRFPS